MHLLKYVDWWARRDLNPHERKAHKILSLACIPISPLALSVVYTYATRGNCTILVNKEPTELLILLWPIIHNTTAQIQINLL